MAEIPLVIVDAQRGGPSTGLPTKMEQSDLNLACYGVHGDAPRIVLAPGDVEECLYYMVHAFNLAEKYQVPVLYLTDQSLAHRTQTQDYELKIDDALLDIQSNRLRVSTKRPALDRAPSTTTATC